MKMVLIKYKEMSILVDESASLELFTANIDAFYDLDIAVKELYKNLLNATKQDTDNIAIMRKNLKPFSDELKVIGTPFDNYDAELYALDRKIDYDVLELQYEKPAESEIRIKVLTRIKSAYVKQAQRENKKLSSWILDQCNKGLDKDLA